MELAPQPVDEADVRRMDVEHPEGAAAGTEAVLDVRRHGEERARAAAVPVAVEEELDLALEHVERVNVVGVGVRVDALEVRPERELECLQLRQVGQDAVPALADPLAFAGPDEERLLRHATGSRRTSRCTRTRPTPSS